MKFLNWKDDKWLSEQGSILRYDKLEHLILGFVGFWILFILCLAFVNAFYPARSLVKVIALFVAGMSFVVATAWEIKDGTVPYDGIHIQGFSWKDLIAGSVGIVFAYILILLSLVFIALILVFMIIPVFFLIKIKEKK